MIEPYGGFILVHIATSVDVCEQRDHKDLYAKARAGILKEFTGISDPYAVPPDAEVTINTGDLSPEEAAQGDHPAPGKGGLYRNGCGVCLIRISVRWKSANEERLKLLLSWAC